METVRNWILSLTIDSDPNEGALQRAGRLLQSAFYAPSKKPVEDAQRLVEIYGKRQCKLPERVEQSVAWVLKEYPEYQPARFMQIKVDVVQARWTSALKELRQLMQHVTDRESWKLRLLRAYICESIALQYFAGSSERRSCLERSLLDYLEVERSEKGQDGDLQKANQELLEARRTAICSLLRHEAYPKESGLTLSLVELEMLADCLEESYAPEAARSYLFRAVERGSRRPALYARIARCCHAVWDLPTYAQWVVARLELLPQGPVSPVQFRVVSEAIRAAYAAAKDGRMPEADREAEEAFTSALDLERQDQGLVSDLQLLSHAWSGWREQLAQDAQAAYQSNYETQMGEQLPVEDQDLLDDQYF